MGEMKHTPGPWKVGYRALHVVAVNAKIGGETPVCDIRGWGYLTGNGHGALGLTGDEAEAIQIANARLIAAAPEMLEALTRLRNEAVLDGLSSRPGWDAFISHADEVIAKATLTKEPTDG